MFKFGTDSILQSCGSHTWTLPDKEKTDWFTQYPYILCIGKLASSLEPVVPLLLWHYLSIYLQIFFSCIDWCEIFQVEEEREKLTLVNTELSKLTQNLSKSAEMEKKVQDLEQKLQLANSKSDDQARKKQKDAMKQLELPWSVVTSN